MTAIHCNVRSNSSASNVVLEASPCSKATARVQQIIASPSKDNRKVAALIRRAWKGSEEVPTKETSQMESSKVVIRTVTVAPSSPPHDIDAKELSLVFSSIVDLKRTVSRNEWMDGWRNECSIFYLQTVRGWCCLILSALLLFYGFMDAGGGYIISNGPYQVDRQIQLILVWSKICRMQSLLWSMDVVVINLSVDRHTRHGWWLSLSPFLPQILLA